MYELDPHYHDWCDENCEGKWAWTDRPDGFFVMFEKESDAMLYRLRFGSD